MALRDWVRQKQMQETGGMPESASFHSKGYHRYFEGYSEQMVTDEKGRKRIKRVYTGVYHRAEISDARLGWTKRTYFLILVLSALLFLYAVSRDVPSNQCWYVAVFQALAVLFFLWLLYSLICYATAGRNMTVNDFRSVAAVKRAASCKAGCELLTAAMSLVYLLVSAAQGEAVDVPGECICMLLCLGAGALTLFIPYLEKRIVYTSFLSRETPLPDGNQIES